MTDKLPPAAREFTLIGVEQCACPTCGVVLEKRPQRKTMCPHCRAAIYARTRPIDEAKVLLREDQLQQLEREWSLDYRLKYVTQDPREIERVTAAQLRTLAEKLNFDCADSTD